MKTAKNRNDQFEILVKEIQDSNLTFSKKLLIATAFAESHGLKFQFDSAHFELWSKSFSRKPLFTVAI